jgi:hypothetical protein
LPSNRTPLLEVKPQSKMKMLYVAACLPLVNNWLQRMSFFFKVTL